MDPLVASLRSSVYHDVKRKEQLIAGLEDFLYSTDAKERNGARRLMLEFDAASALRLMKRRDIGDEYLKYAEKADDRVRKLFDDSMTAAHRGFYSALVMDVTVFAVGIILILVSVATALSHGVTGSSLLSWEGTGAAGGSGLLAMAYTVFIGGPRERVKFAVDHVMGIKVRAGGPWGAGKDSHDRSEYVLLCLLLN